VTRDRDDGRDAYDPVPAPRKGVLPGAEPVNAADRLEEVVAKRFARNQKEVRDDGRPAYARLCLRNGPPEVHAFGRLEWRPPVLGAHRFAERLPSRPLGTLNAPSTCAPQSGRTKGEHHDAAMH
jgi:hypothetical protein